MAATIANVSAQPFKAGSLPSRLLADTLGSVDVSGMRLAGSFDAGIQGTITAGTAITIPTANLAPGSILYHAVGAAAQTLNMPTGTALSAAYPSAQIGDSWEILVVNSSSNTVTIAGATGTTCLPVSTSCNVLTVTSGRIKLVKTGGATWNVIRAN